MKNKIFFFLLGTVFVVGLSFVLYPTLSNLINNSTNESYIDFYDNNVMSLSNSEKTNLKEEALEYNQAISADYLNESTDNYKKIISSYNEILNFNNGIICYIEIPKINVKLPVYHGSDDVLDKGAAHLEKTSFPIGEINSHAAISAHSGYPAQKFFDNIDELEIGDVFYINILDEKLEYKIYKKQVVEPNDSSALKIIPNKDIVTLITCYPYGINTQRLLVHAERVISNSSTYDEPSNDKNNTLFLFIPATILFFIVALILIIRHFNSAFKARKSKKR